MMFRKKPVVVEAKQWFQHGDHPAVERLKYPLARDYNPEVYGQIRTLEGDYLVSPRDWIITGVKGEHYPCKPDIFDETYEPI